MRLYISKYLNLFYFYYINLVILLVASVAITSAIGASWTYNFIITVLLTLGNGYLKLLLSATSKNRQEKTEILAKSKSNSARPIISQTMQE